MPTEPAQFRDQVQETSRQSPDPGEGASPRLCRQSRGPAIWGAVAHEFHAVPVRLWVGRKARGSWRRDSVWTPSHHCFPAP